MVTMQIESFEYVQMIDDRLRQCWDYSMSDEEFDSMQRYFDGQDGLKHPDYVADNYHVNSDKGDGELLLERIALTEESLDEFLDDCCFYWGADLVYEVLRDDTLDNSAKRKQIEELCFDRFGFVYSF